MFGDLKFVIIDEIHAFMGSERGCQILCQLARLSNLTQTQPCRIGLSATLGDYSLAETWLASGTQKPVITPKIENSKRKVNLALEHFYIDNECNSSIRTQDLISPAEAPKLQKYDACVPPELLRKAFVLDYLDLDELKLQAATWQC